jgi:hypothetical protein
VCFHDNQCFPEYLITYIWTEMIPDSTRLPPPPSCSPWNHRFPFQFSIIIRQMYSFWSIIWSHKFSTQLQNSGNLLFRGVLLKFKPHKHLLFFKLNFANTFKEYQIQFFTFEVYYSYSSFFSVPMDLTSDLKPERLDTEMVISLPFLVSFTRKVRY